MTVSVAQKGASGLVYGDKTWFSIDAPNGWMLDPQTAKKVGLPVVIYPANSSWDQAEAAMYANFAEKTGGQKNLRSVIDFDIAKGKAHGANPITKQGSLRTADGREATIYRFGKTYGNHKGVDLVAYIDMPDAVAMLVLTSKSPEGAKRSEGAFDSLVKSVHYLGKAKIETGRTKPGKTKGA